MIMMCQSMSFISSQTAAQHATAALSPRCVAKSLSSLRLDYKSEAVPIHVHPATSVILI